MRRSEINQYMKDALSTFQQFQFKLPPWSTWTAEEWQRNQDTARWCQSHQMGWDITDFGGNDFLSKGLILFCIRNGKHRSRGSIPYAEKIMIVREEQETPLHFHLSKAEDIIVRGGGNLVVELFNKDDHNQLQDTSVSVRTDGRLREVEAGKPLILHPGESITIPQGLYHRFYGQAGTGTCLVGEVSKVNDDLSDNYFYESIARFSDIEEDEPMLFPLWNEIPVLET